MYVCWDSIYVCMHTCGTSSNFICMSTIWSTTLSSWRVNGIERQSRPMVCIQTMQTYVEHMCSNRENTHQMRISIWWQWFSPTVVKLRSSLEDSLLGSRWEAIYIRFIHLASLSGYFCQNLTTTHCILRPHTMLNNLQTEMQQNALYLETSDIAMNIHNLTC